ncbi:MAG: cupin domain-containing protein [Gulosibacter sp.]|uniref:cupin domain-containing protein n=1 Tax=Gulosibacter sp. TaxID=2817531 RepID=UPI003F93B7C9
MKVLPEGDKDYVYAGRFTGDVQLEMIIEAAEPTEVDLARVHCCAGAVTKWHSHPGGQVLVLQSGVGRVGSADGMFGDLQPGTAVDTPANEMHWHGAEDGSDCVWLSFAYGVTDWTDENPLDGAPAPEVR